MARHERKGSELMVHVGLSRDVIVIRGLGFGGWAPCSEPGCSQDTLKGDHRPR